MKKPCIDIKTSNAPHRIFLVRHGETDWNRAFRYQGSSDVELNASGLDQARRAGLRLARVVPDRVFTSPLLRALRTAETIMEQNDGDTAITLCDDIREISFGVWEGLTITEIKKKDPDTLAAWRDAPFSRAPAEGEKMDDVVLRSRRASGMIKGSAEGGGVTFVVAHGAVLRALLGVMMDIGDIDIMWKMRFDNCSVTVLDLWRGRPSLLLVNDTHHIRMPEGDIPLLTFPV
jgi:alpha-ribazole phosphatase/probable phosphoglycerate mutase